tara:strand:- start:2809 stop:3057 length:249 start_codon:yes stop_codon:yes gene_type:complete
MKNKGLVIAGIIFVGVVIYLKRQKDKKDKAISNGENSPNRMEKCTKEASSMRFSSKEGRDEFMTKCLEGKSNFSSADCGCGA